MPADVYVRPFRADDSAEKKLFLDWLYARRAENRFDPEIFQKNQATILTCYDESGIIGFIPITLALRLESLAFKPGLSPVSEAKAMQAMQHFLVHRAAEKNIPDAEFFTLDANVLEFAKRHGWKEPVVPFLNLHFADLEPKHDCNGQSGI